MLYGKNTKKKNSAIFCYTRQVTSSESFAHRNNLMGGIKLILVQFSSETDWSTAHLVQKVILNLLACIQKSRSRKTSPLNKNLDTGVFKNS